MKWAVRTSVPKPQNHICQLDRNVSSQHYRLDVLVHFDHVLVLGGIDERVVLLAHFRILRGKGEISLHSMPQPDSSLTSFTSTHSSFDAMYWPTVSMAALMFCTWELCANRFSPP